MREKLKDEFYEFDDFLLDINQQCVFRNGKVISGVTPLLFSLLVLFVQREGEILNREALKAAWNEPYVNEAKVNKAVTRLREALRTHSEGKNYIETLPRRGYRFTALITIPEESRKLADSAPQTAKIATADLQGDVSTFFLPQLNEPEPLLHSRNFSPEKFLGGHLNFALLVCLLYAGWYVVAFAVELAYQFTAYQQTIFWLTPLIFLWMLGTSFAGLLINWKLSRREDLNGLLFSIFVFILAAALLFIAVRPYLPAIAVTVSATQSQPAQAAYLKAPLYALPMAIFFLLIPFQFILLMQRKLEQGKRQAVKNILNNKSLLHASSDSLYIRREAFGALLVVMAISTIVGTFWLFDHLVATEFTNLFEILFLLRVALWFAVALTCLGWYAISLNRLKTACFITSTAAQGATNKSELPMMGEPSTRTPYRLLAVLGFSLSLIAILGSAFYLSSTRKLKPVNANKETSRPSILVLPLQPLNLSQRYDYLATGLTDMVLARLHRFRHLDVRSSRSQSLFAGTSDVIQVARDLGTQWVLDGNLQQEQDRLRVTIKLLRVSDGSSLWAETTDEPISRTLALEDRIGKKLDEAIALYLSGDNVAAVAPVYTNNEQAYEEYLRGRYFFSMRNEASMKKALAAFQRATMQDPNFALAYIGLADAYLYLGSAGYSSLPPQVVLPKANAALQQAMNLNAASADLHTTLGYIKWFYEWDWTGAIKEYETALQLNANNATAHQRYGLCLITLGRLDEALAEMKLAHHIEPGSLIFPMWVAQVLYYKGDYEQAIEGCENLLEMDEKFYPARLHLGLFYAQTGRFTEAQAALQQAGDLYASPLVCAYSGYAYALAGNRKAAEQRLEELRQMTKRQPVSPYCFSLITAGLGDRESTFAFLEQTYVEHSGHLTDIQVDPVFTLLRDDARYSNLLQRLKLPL
jgi:TolB-like protein/DNA-binding winged helix-turn-helix (wHTH) protein/Flp pilus assembly protein TadD